MLRLTIKVPRVQGQAARRETVSGKLQIGRLLRGGGGSPAVGSRSSGSMTELNRRL